MGDFQNQQVGAEQDDLQNRDAQAAAKEHPATAQVRALLASGDVKAIGEIIRNHREAEAQIYALLHKTKGNRFVTQVQQFSGIDQYKPGAKPNNFEETMADLATKPSEQSAQASGGEANGAQGPRPPAVDFAALRANAEDNSPLNTPLESASPAAPAKASGAAPASGGLSKEQSELKEIEAYEAELKPKGPSASSKGADLKAETQAFEQEPNNANAVNPNAPPINYEGADGKQHHLYERPKVDQNQLRRDVEPSNPVAASKVLKDETVIASSAEVKQPEVVRATEVLKDPNQSDEPQKASDVVKHDDAENEGSGGGAKADAGPVKITASVLRVRSSPKISKANIVGRLTKGDVVEAIGHSGEWVEIKYKGQTAFVHSSFVVSAQETVVAKAPDQAAPATAT